MIPTNQGLNTDLPQTNQGSQAPQRKTAAQMHYNFPPFPLCLYITPQQLSKIITMMQAQGIYPDGAEIRRDGADDFLPDTIGDGTYYSLYWRDSQGLHADQLGYLYNTFQDHLVASQRVNNPFPVMFRNADNGTISFR
jgi:hypothetical protein